MSARVQSDPFDLASELAGFGAGAGAVVTFTGIVRDDGGMLDALEIEHYPGMTERALTDPYAEKQAPWGWYGGILAVLLLAAFVWVLRDQLK